MRKKIGAVMRDVSSPTSYPSIRKSWKKKTRMRRKKKDGGGGGHLVAGQQNSASGETVRVRMSEEGERWRHFTCWRMKVFIVAKMRATLQKQHRDTAVTQPGSPGPRPLPVCLTVCLYEFLPAA